MLETKEVDEKVDVETKEVDEKIEERYDLVIYGATGFTGKFIIRYCAERVGKKFTFAISGRSKQKLEDLKLDIIKRYPQGNFDDLPILVADVKDSKALKGVAMKAKVLVNATGPYRYFGDYVVDACLEGGAHYVDISGETDWIEKNAIRCQDKAREKGLFIVSSCGFDSVPSDLGMVWVENFYRKNNARLSCVDEYVEHTGPDVPGNATTYRALVDGYGNIESSKQVRKEIESQPWRVPRKELKRIGPKHRPLRGSYWWDERVGGYSTLNTFADNAIIANSQGMRAALLGQQTGEQPSFPQYAIYFVIAHSYWELLPFIGMGINLKMFTGSKWGRNFLKKHPQFATAGMFTDNVFGKTTEEEFSKVGFKITMFAKGFSDEQKHDDTFDEFATATITGPDIGYNATAALVIECGLQILWNLDTISKGDLEKMAPKLEGGCYTPGTVFAATDLIQVLEDSGKFKFEIVKTDGNQKKE